MPPAIDPEGHIAHEFSRWLDAAFACPPTEDVVAYCVNLYDAPFRADIIGAGSYDPEDPDWAGDEAWRPKTDPFEFPDEVAALSWDVRLSFAERILAACLEGPSVAAWATDDAQAVAIGFVDGDLRLIRRRSR